MLFLLYLVIPVGFINLLLALFFPFPAPLIGVGLQSIFFFISVIVFVSRLSRRKGLIRSVLAAGIHGFILAFTINLYVHAVIPNQEKDEYSVFKTSTGHLMGSLWNKVTGGRPTGNPDNRQIPAGSSLPVNSKVEDPF